MRLPSAMLFCISAGKKRKTMSEKQLRSGYTTGTCAAAAAKAAALLLFSGICPEYTEVRLPVGKTAGFKTVCSECRWWEKTGTAVYVIKDGGDDPDVTHGAKVYASVSRISQEELNRLRVSGSGYWLSEYPCCYLTGGPGVGIVTKPGLSCPVGHYAINPIPRQMILSSVNEILTQMKGQECLLIQTAIPEGILLAEHTFNPKLGIVNGISVLGTTGIVKPMSEEALLATIALDIHMKAAEGKKMILMAPGNYGEAFLQEQMGVPLGEAVLCSNFVRDSVRMLEEEGISKMLFVSHIGKLIKVSAGIENTHSKYGDGRMEQMEGLTKEAEPDDLLLRQAVRNCNTTDEAVELLLKKGKKTAETVLNYAAEKAKRWMENWSGDCCQIEVITFSSSHRIIGATEGAEAMLRLWKEQK